MEQQNTTTQRRLPLIDASALPESTVAELRLHETRERERLGLREKAGDEVLPCPIAQRHRRDLRVKFFHLSRRQNRHITIGMRRRQKRVRLLVGIAPRRRNRQPTLLVEGVPEKARIKSFAG